MKITSIVVILFFTWIKFIPAQDTFSIVAADSTTREVGSAGASCLDLFSIGISDPSFLGDLLPDTGAINTQSFYLENNQKNARVRMRAGDSPQEIIDWLATHDAAGNPTQRQYGIAGFTGGASSAAGYTGVNCIDYKEHRTGSINGIAYSIQGNILLGPMVIDSMEARFRRAPGDLACRIMEAMQGAKMIGADSRCTPEGTSSMFAFLKVAQPGDAYGSPSFSISVRTHAGSQIEPIDTLQSLFDEVHSCEITAIQHLTPGPDFKLYPNPAQDRITVSLDPWPLSQEYSLLDSSGKILISGILSRERPNIELHSLPPGVYILKIGQHLSKSFIKQ